MDTSRVRSLLILTILACASTILCLAQAVSTHSPQHLFFRVTLGTQQTATVSGRLLIFLQPGTELADIKVKIFHLSSVYVAAKDVDNWEPGESVDIDTDDLAFPTGFSQIPPGDYVVQAVLDTAHRFDYYGRVAGDLQSEPMALGHWTPSAETAPQLTLSQKFDPPEQPWLSPKLTAAEKQAATDAIQTIDIESAVLTQFWGRPMLVSGWVVLPPGYKEHREQHYPTVFWTHGFQDPDYDIHAFGGRVYQRMAEGKMPPMIWVLLNESTPRGTHEFADSVNTGPWGTALTTEIIPALESQYRMDAKSRGRFLNGHSSGGWAALWLQVTYPKIFGGAWPSSPDPSDFHDFMGIDLYATHANVYTKPDGSKYPFVRSNGKVLGNQEDLTKMEDVLGAYGGQMRSFDWVFSPRGPDGRPVPLFDHATGEVDPAVVAYWQKHYDIAYRVTQQWQTIGPDLRGKVHLYVGTADSFYLDGPAHRLDAVFQSLHANEEFNFLPNRTHMDVYRVGDDPEGLLDHIAAQMYAIARPNEHWKPKDWKAKE